MIWIVKKLVLSHLFIVLIVAELSSVSDSRRLAGTNLQWTWPSPRITVSDAFLFASWEARLRSTYFELSP